MRSEEIREKILTIEDLYQENQKYKEVIFIDMNEIEYLKIEPMKKESGE